MVHKPVWQSCKINFEAMDLFYFEAMLPRLLTDRMTDQLSIITLCACAEGQKGGEELKLGRGVISGQHLLS